MEKITHIICFAVKLIMALLIVGGMVFIITVNSVCRTAFATFTSALAYGLLMCSFFFFYFYHSQEVTCERYEEHVGAKGGKIMPWSIYQDIQGATFLLNMAALLKAKMTTLNSLNILQEFASPWLSTRLDSIIYRVRQGDHLGLALRQCGYQFPSREAANFLSLLQGDGATELISNYGQRWLSQTLQRVKKRANVIRLIMLIFLVMSLMLLVFAIMDIQSISDNSMGNF